VVAKNEKIEVPAAIADSFRDILNTLRGLGTWCRSVHPGSLTDELLALIGRRAREIEARFGEGSV
jgi:hypothetical protein